MQADDSNNIGRRAGGGADHGASARPRANAIFDLVS